MIFIALTLALPELGHEAGPEYDPGVYLEENALIMANAFLSQKGLLIAPEIMQKIAKCESGDRHFNERGEVLRGRANRFDIGRYQINRLYWEEEAKKLDHDIFSEYGNEAFALHLYQKYGTGPWKRSQRCWSKL